MRYAHRPLPPRLVALLLVVVFAAGCGDSTADPVVEPIASVATSLPKLHFMAPGDTFRIGALARDAMDTTMPEIPVTWSTSDSTVVEVDGSGGVRAVGPGEAVVRATAGSGVTGNVPVRVDDRPGISCSDDPVTIERIDDEPFHWYFDTKILLQPDPTGLVAYAIGSDPGLIRSALEETGLTALEIEHNRWVQLPETTTLAEARAAVEALRQDPRLTFVSLLYRRSNGDRDRLVNRLLVRLDEGATQEDIVCLNRSVGLTLESEKPKDGYLRLTLPLGLEPLSVANYYHLSSLTEWAEMDRIGEGSPQGVGPPASAARTRSR